MTKTLDDPLAARLEPLERIRNGVPDQATDERRRRGAALARVALAEAEVDAEVRTSPLGDGWSGDVDAYVTSPPADGDLLARGWIPLRAILRALGRPPADRWAVVDADDVVLTGLDVHSGAAPDRVTAVLERCRRRGEVRAREVLELRGLVGTGHRLPAGDEVVAIAADVEADLGGNLLAQRRRGPPRHAPAQLPGWRPRVAALRNRAAARVRHRRVTVALSGVDGAGKSTLAEALHEALLRVGVPATVVWTRPGLRLGALAALARVAKRCLGQPPEPGVRSVASGDSVPRSRQGVVGWTWATAVLVAYATDVWRRQLRAEGLVIHDRHALDALVTMDVLYAGVDLAPHRWILAHALPRAALVVYLEVPAEVAIARKPGDTIGDTAVRRQLDRYAARLGSHRDILVLDATTPTATQTIAVLRALESATSSGRGRGLP